MQEADHLLIPLLDGSQALAQVARVNDTRALVHITDRRSGPDTKVRPIPAGDVLATLRVDRTGLTEEQWPIIGYDALPKDLGTRPAHLTDGDALAPAIVEAFTNAIFGLYPWDGFPDPDFFTNLLRTPGELPKHIRTTADFPKPDAS